MTRHDPPSSPGRRENSRRQTGSCGSVQAGALGQGLTRWGRPQEVTKSWQGDRVGPQFSGALGPDRAAELVMEGDSNSSFFLGLDQHGRWGFLIPSDYSVPCMWIACLLLLTSTRDCSLTYSNLDSRSKSLLESSPISLTPHPLSLAKFYWFLPRITCLQFLLPLCGPGTSGSPMGVVLFSLLVLSMPVSLWLQFTVYIAAKVVFLEQKCNPVSLVYSPPMASAFSWLPAPTAIPNEPVIQIFLTSPCSWIEDCLYQGSPFIFRTNSTFLSCRNLCSVNAFVIIHVLIITCDV